MKSIPNVQTSLPPIKQGGKPSTYADLLHTCLESNQGGFTIELMRKRDRVMKAIEKVKSGDVMKLEDADYETARDAIKSMTWAINHPAIIAFAEAFGL